MNGLHGRGVIGMELMMNKYIVMKEWRAFSLQSLEYVTWKWELCSSKKETFKEASDLALLFNEKKLEKNIVYSVYCLD